jgi:hypothetical protein
MRQGRLIILHVLAIAVGVIAARVEFLNAAAGHYLPRTDPRDVGKRRTTFLDEERWRRLYGPRDESGGPVVRELTAEERRQMRSDIARMDANDRLRDWVRSAGLLQYLLLPALVISTAAAIGAKPTRRRIVGLLPVVAVIVFASASLWYRAYFSSLER